MIRTSDAVVFNGGFFGLPYLEVGPTASCLDWCGYNVVRYLMCRGQTVISCHVHGDNVWSGEVICIWGVSHLATAFSGDCPARQMFGSTVPVCILQVHSNVLGFRQKYFSLVSNFFTFLFFYPIIVRGASPLEHTLPAFFHRGSIGTSFVNKIYGNSTA